jgi:hypothetical protein
LKLLKEIQAKTPTIDTLLAKRLKQAKSKYPLRQFGFSQDGPVWISEEERESHLHILGTTGEGKSKFIEYLIREDIRRGNGVCLLDPTDRGETCYSILRWCASQGFEKVCLIDPHLIYSHDRVTCIQPFNRKKSYKDATVSNVMDTMRILFDMKDMAHFAFVQQNLPALIRVLWNAGLTLHESKYFTKYKQPLYGLRRDEILEHSHPLDDDRLTIEEAFQTPTNYKEFGSTARRLRPMFEGTVGLMFAAEKGVDFVKMISEGWVVLVNLDAEAGVEPLHSRLLGTMVINELLFAMYRLRNSPKGEYKKPYYLYIDEAGQYINDKLQRIMEVKRHSNFRLTVAHQGFFQFPRDKAQAVSQLTKIKVLFNTPDYDDRLRMIKALGYGGDIPHTLATYANQDLPKQTAIIKKGKESPVRVKIPDVPEAKISKEAENEFINRCLSHEWNLSPAQIREQLSSRFEKARPNPKVAKGRTAPNKSADSGSIKRRTSIFSNQ